MTLFDILRDTFALIGLAVVAWAALATVCGLILGRWIREQQS